MELDRSTDFEIEDYLRLGRAIGAVFGENSVLLVARDGLHVSRLAKRTIVVGIAASGASVLDFRLAPEVLVEFAVGKGNGDAGVYVHYDLRGVAVEFHATQHQEERAARILEVFRAREFPHVPLSALGEVSLYPNAVEDFVRDMHKRVHFLKGQRILVDCLNTPLAVLAPPLFESYGMKVTLFNDALATYQEPKGLEAFLARLRDGGFQWGVRMVPGAPELYRPGGEREGFADLEGLLRRIGAT